MEVQLIDKTPVQQNYNSVPRTLHVELKNYLEQKIGLIIHSLPIHHQLWLLERKMGNYGFVAITANSIQGLYRPPLITPYTEH